MQVKIDMDINHIEIPMIITMTIAGWERLYDQLNEKQSHGGVAAEFLTQIKRIVKKFEPLRDDEEDIDNWEAKH